MTKERRKELFQYIYEILENKNCHLYRLNGVEDHLHIVTHINPTISISSLVKDIKLASSYWIKTNKIFKNFNGWQEGYGAFTYSIKEKDRLIEYVKNQEQHHKKTIYKDELILLLKEHGVDYDEKYLD